MPGLARQFLLPYYARPDLGWQDVIIPTLPAPGQAFTRIVPGETAEIVQSCYCEFTTSAAAVNRILVMQMIDASGHVIAQSISPMGQPANSVYGYSFSSELSAPSSPSAGQAEMPVVPGVAVPGFKIVIDNFSFQAGDSISRLALTLQRYPTSGLDEVPPDVVESSGLIGATATDLAGAFLSPSSDTFGASGGFASADAPSYSPSASPAAAAQPAPIPEIIEVIPLPGPGRAAPY